MALLIIETDEGTHVSHIHITNQHGPWTDGGEMIDAIVHEINTALRLEGDEA
jgi:hypothetical protein